ncbi:MAG: zf-HC2 domain-containing protein [Armatimonadetes bacterium]|nr:zf-HC2 domain-containing protein [Armatimonadota bacterium]
MRCPVGRDVLEGYIDGELEPAQESELEAHLASCQECERKAHFVRTLKSAVRQRVSQEATPAGLRSRILQSLAPAAHTEPDESRWAAYVDGELPEAERLQLERQFAEIPDGQKRLDFQRRLKAALRDLLQQERTPELLRRRILKALSEIRPLSARSSGREWLRPALVAASVLVVSFLALMFPFVTPSQASPLIVAMGNDHDRCSQVGAGSGCKPDPLAMAQETFGRHPEMIDLPDRLAYYDARMCPFPTEASPDVLHVLYVDRQRGDAKVSFFGLPDPGENLPEQMTCRVEPRLFECRGFHAAAWKRNGWVYSLVGAMPARDLEELVHHSSYALERHYHRLLLGLRSRPSPHSFLPGRPLAAAY